MLKVTNLSKSFKSTHVICNISFLAEKGDVIALVGKNGTGKTTLLRILADLVSKDGGKITFENSDLQRSDTSLITNNDRSFFWRLSSYENLKYFLGMSGLESSKIGDSIHMIAKKFRIEDKLDQVFSSLSSGEKKKISLIRMLLKKQKIVLFDEVTTALDLETKNLLIQYLKDTQLSEDKKVIIWATHDIDEIKGFCSKYILLHGASIKKEGILDTDPDKHLNMLKMELDNG